MEGASLCCITASQAAVQDLVQQAAPGPTVDGFAPGGGAAAGRHAAGLASGSAWQQAVALHGVGQLTLLLPRDARGELGLETRCIPLAAVGRGPAGGGSAQQRQLTAAQLLELVHSYYQEQVRRGGGCMAKQMVACDVSTSTAIPTHSRVVLQVPLPL